MKRVSVLTKDQLERARKKNNDWLEMLRENRTSIAAGILATVETHFESGSVVVRVVEHPLILKTIVDFIRNSHTPSSRWFTGNFVINTQYKLNTIFITKK